MRSARRSPVSISTSSGGSAERRFSAAPLRSRRRGPFRNGRERNKSLRGASKTGVLRRPAPRNDNRARPKGHSSERARPLLVLGDEDVQVYGLGHRLIT